MTSRRGFLSLLGAAAVGLVAHELDLDRLLWVPGRQRIFLPPLAAHLPIGNRRLLTIETITREAVLMFENQLALTHALNRAYDMSFTVEGAKIGTVLNVRKPPRFQM